MQVKDFGPHTYPLANGEFLTVTCRRERYVGLLGAVIEFSATYSATLHGQIRKVVRFECAYGMITIMHFDAEGVQQGSGESVAGDDCNSGFEWVQTHLIAQHAQYRRDFDAKLRDLRGV